MRLSLLDRLLTTEVGVSFGFGLAFFSTLLAMNHAFSIARLAVSQGMPFRIVLQLFIYKVPYVVALSAPMAVLLATVLGIGRLTDHHEIAALRVCGMSLYRIATPVVLLGVLAAVGVLVFIEGVVNAANEQYRSVYNAFVTKAPELQPVENVFFQGPSPDGEAQYYARRYNPRTHTLEDVTVIYLRGGQALRVIQAGEATYRQGGAWGFHNGTMYVIEPGRIVTTRFEEMTLNVPRTPQDLTLPPKPAADMSLPELFREASAARRRGADPRSFLSELHTRIAFSASSVIFALVGVPLSLRPHRSGPGVGMGLSILVLFAYYMLLIPFQLASEGRILPPGLAAWLPDGILGGLGGVLLVRAAR